MRRSEQGFAVITAVVFLAVLLILGASLVEQTVQELSVASREKKETGAFSLAEAGIDYAAWRIYNIQTPSLPITWSRSDLGTGTFSVTADRFNGSSNTLTVISTGTTQGYTSQVKVIGMFLTNGPTDQNIVFDHALFSNATLTLGGTANINGSIMANGNVTINGTPSVTGDVYSGGTISGASGPAFHPNMPKAPMPVIDINYYRSKASVILPSGSNMPNTIDGIVFVDGDMHLSGSQTISGKGTIVVTGDVRINSNTVLNLADSDSEFAIVCAGSIRTNGNCTIDGYLYAHNVKDDASFTGNGTANITGGVAADIISKANGNLTVTYRVPTVELPGATAAPAQFAAVSWRRVR